MNFRAMIETDQFDPRHALAVVGHRADRAGDVRSVAVVVHRIAGVADEIVAVQVAAEAVLVFALGLVQMFAARSRCV